MTATRLRLIVACGVLASSVFAAPAHADWLVFTNGRTMAVASHQIDGEVMTVTFAQGGEARFPRRLVAEVLPDEIPPAAPAPPVTPDEAPTPEATFQPAPPTAPTPAMLAARPYASLIARVSSQHGVDPVLVHAVVEAESNYQPRARSRAGARGLMQVMPSTASSYGVRNLYDPQSNLDVGVRYLRSLLDRFDLTHAIAAYNAGPAAVERYQGVPPFAETQSYVRKVLSAFSR